MPALKTNEYLQAIVRDLKLAIDRQGLTTTGRARGSIRIRNNRNIISVGYLSFLFRGIGRAPGRRPPVQNIQDWIEAKGLQWSSDTGRPFTSTQMAFMVANTIRDKGTRIFRDRRRGIQVREIIEKNNRTYMPRIARDLKNTYVQAFNLSIVT